MNIMLSCPTMVNRDAVKVGHAWNQVTRDESAPECWLASGESDSTTAATSSRTIQRRNQP
jgi:hypothetical protein